MKRALIISIVTALAFPALGEQPKTSDDRAAQIAQQAEEVQDSPLVAAAKRAKRQGRTSTSVVITNATLKDYHANAHITTTTNQRSLKLPDPPERAANQSASATARKPAQSAAAVKKAGTDAQRGTGATMASEATEIDYNPRGLDVDREVLEKVWRDAHAIHETDPDAAEKYLREAFDELEREQKPPHE